MTASTAGLPEGKVWVRVGPPLLASVVLRMALSDCVGTISVGPGLNPSTPALPSWPNRLKLLAMTVCWLSNSGADPLLAVLPEINVRLSVRVPRLLTPPPEEPVLPEIVVLVRVKVPRPPFITAPPLYELVFPEIVLFVTVEVMKFK